MYKLTKSKGYMAVVTVTETESYASIDLGTPSMTMLDILTSAGILEEGADKAYDKWEFDIEKDVADKLFALAMNMKKPIRKQKEKVKVNNDEIDAMDVLLGLAHYSK